MKLIVALGNPTKQYENTRHNVGVIALNMMLKSLSSNNTWKYDKKFNSNILELNISDLSKLTSEYSLFKKINEQCIFNDTKVVCAFPQTYMNNSGSSILLLLNYFKLKPPDIIVFHDDLDVRLGKYLIHNAKGPKQHNGIISIENKVGKEFWRLRIGVDNRNVEDKISGMDYVLNNFSDEELNILNSMILDG